MPPRLNTIPDPSQGYLGCKQGMNTVDDMFTLQSGECEDLLNMFPGDPPKVRPGNRDIFADDTKLLTVDGVGYTTRYTPYAISTTAPDGDEYIFAWAVANDVSSPSIYYVLEMINITNNTRVALQTIKFDTPQKNVHFGFLKLHSSVYCVFDKPVKTNYTNQYITQPIIIYWTGATYVVRQMGFEIAPDIAVVQHVEAAQQNFSGKISTAETVVFKQNIFMIGGYQVGDNEKLSSAVYKSGNGKDWVKIGDLPLPLIYHSAIVFSGKMWVFGGNTNEGTSSRTFSSIDGVAWVESSQGLPVPLERFGCAIFENKLYTVGGFSIIDGVVTYRQNVLRTADGVTWESCGLLNIGTCAGAAVVIGSKLFYIGGSHTERKVYETINGEDWSEVGTDVLAEDFSYGAAVVLDDTCFLVHTEGGGVYSSVNGSVWTPRQSHPAPLGTLHVTAIIYNKSLLIFAGDVYYTKYESATIDDVTYVSQPGDKWTLLTTGIKQEKTVTTAFTFVRRTDPASLLDTLNEYRYSPWEVSDGKLMIGTDERALRGTISVGTYVEDPPFSYYDNFETVFGVDTFFTTEVTAGDCIRIDGGLFNFEVASVISDTEMTIINPREFIYINKIASVLPKIGDSITTDVYEPGDVEGIEDAGLRHTITINTESGVGRILVTMPDNAVEAIAKGATHLRYYRTLGADSDAIATGLTQGWVCDIALSSTTFYAGKVYIDDSTDDALTGAIANLYVQAMNTATRTYSAPPFGRYIDWVRDQLFIAGEDGFVYLSEIPGGDGAKQTTNHKKYASEFSLSEYYIACDPDAGTKNTGAFGYYGDLIIVKEDEIFSVSNADRTNPPVSISEDFGCPFPGTIVKTSHPTLGTCVFFESNRGPAVLLPGSTVKLIKFKISELTPPDLTISQNAGKLWQYNGSPTTWDTRNRITAHYSHDCYWVHWGDSDDRENIDRQTMDRYPEMFGYHVAMDAGFRVDFPALVTKGNPTITFEPHVFVELKDRTITLSHKNDGSTAIYRITEFLCKNVISDTYIHTVSGCTERATENSAVKQYSIRFMSRVVPTSARLDLAAEVFSLILYMSRFNGLNISIYADRSRLLCQGDYVQVRQSGITDYGSDNYRYKLMAVPKSGLFGSVVQFVITSVIDSPSFKFHGGAFQVISRNLPVEFLSGLGVLTAPAGSLTFIKEANVVPEVNVYE